MAGPLPPLPLDDLDAVVVLGKELRRDPDRAVRELRARAAAASACLRAGVPKVATLEAPLRGQQEAGSALVRRLLRELDVDSQRVLHDTVTRSTREEAIEVGRLARRQGWTTALIVTARYHVPRAAAYFAELEGLDAPVVSPEALLPYATDQERAWIDAGTPSPQAMAREVRTERLFVALGGVLSPLPRPARWRLEVLAGVALRGVPGPGSAGR